MNDTYTLDEYLDFIKKNLLESNNIADENIEELQIQRENLTKIDNKLTDMNDTLQETEKKISLMEHPLCPFNCFKFSGKNKKVNLEKKNILDCGYFYKRSKFLKKWNLRYYELY